MITHNVQLINQVCDEIWILDNNRVNVWKGEFDEYRREAPCARRAPPAPRAAPPSAAAARAPFPPLHVCDAPAGRVL